jgi:hypothetical protein
MSQLPDGCADLSVYSPPFPGATGGLYTYSSSEHDLSNAVDRTEFYEHYTFGLEEITRLTKPGRLSAVHVMDIPSGNTGYDHLHDFPGDVIRLHERLGWQFIARHLIHKDALRVRNRTMTKGLAHRTLVEDATATSIASADQLLVFRRSGHNAVPVTHPQGMTEYYGEDQVPHELRQYRKWDGNQIENKFSHWIWQRYAAAIWHDIRLDRTLPYREARENDDERHMHPLQLDVIQRAVTLYSNPGEVVLTPFGGVGSEAYGAVTLRRRAILIELKESYFRQAVRNVEAALTQRPEAEQQILFATQPV